MMKKIICICMAVAMAAALYVPAGATYVTSNSNLNYNTNCNAHRYTCTPEEWQMILDRDDSDGTSSYINHSQFEKGEVISVKQIMNDASAKVGGKVDHFVMTNNGFEFGIDEVFGVEWNNVDILKGFSVLNPYTGEKCGVDFTIVEVWYDDYTDAFNVELKIDTTDFGSAYVVYSADLVSGGALWRTSDYQVDACVGGDMLKHILENDVYAYNYFGEEIDNGYLTILESMDNLINNIVNHAIGSSIYENVMSIVAVENVPDVAPDDSVAHLALR